MRLFLTALSLATLFPIKRAAAELCDHSTHFCGFSKGSTSSAAPAAPSRDNTVRINPSGVPVEKGMGISLIAFDGVDVGLVKGLGRVGVAISPSNSEETFFGPPGLELPENYLKRKQDGKKYPAQKVTLATAFGLLRGKRSGLRRFELNMGVMGKYNTATSAVTPGAGLSGVLGPFTFGYSYYQDQTQLDYKIYGLPEKSVTKFNVETYSAGIYLNSVAIDYSILRMLTTDTAVTTVLTGSLFLKKAMVTAAIRRESSTRPAYNYTFHLLEPQRDKSELFAGVQFNVFKEVMFGVFYNYYVLRELSAGVTWFF